MSRDMKRIKNFILFICSIVFIVIGAVLLIWGGYGIQDTALVSVTVCGLLAIYWLIKTALLIFCERNM